MFRTMVKNIACQNYKQGHICTQRIMNDTFEILSGDQHAAVTFLIKPVT